MMLRCNITPAHEVGVDGLQCLASPVFQEYLYESTKNFAVDCPQDGY